MGYYHENEADDLLDPILLTILEELPASASSSCASAGNDATDRPCYPAAFAPWTTGRGRCAATAIGCRSSPWAP